MERRLAAILAADVVGYSAMMAEDEEGTLAQLNAHRAELFNPKIAEHNGRIVKLMGDGVLVEFASVIDAVECALNVQRLLGESKGNIRLRIGINLGDVILDGNDIYGDGVNVAARLEAEAEPGGVCISDAVHQSLRTKLDAPFEQMGALELKNINRLVHAWRWPPQIALETAQLNRDGPRTLSEATVAVLPFDNMSGDPEQEYFSDGISEDIITELSRSPSLIVIARNSSFAFRGETIDIREVGERLQVNYVLEGSVRKAGQRIRVTAQLIEAKTNAHLWADKYDGTIEDIFDLQDEISRTIVTTLAGRIDDIQAERLSKRTTQSMTAYEHVLRGQKWMQQYNHEAYGNARKCFEDAIYADQNFARAHAGRSLAAFHGWNSTNEAELMAIAKDSGSSALALDPNDSKCHLALGMVYMFKAEHDKAEHHLTRASSLNPNDDLVMVEYGRYKMYAGAPLEGAELVQLAMRRNPFAPNWYWNILGRCLHTAGKFEDAIAAFERIDTPQHFNHAYLAACYAALGDHVVAEKHVDQTLALNPDFTVSGFKRQLPYRNKADLTQFLDGLLEAGLPT